MNAYLIVKKYKCLPYLELQVSGTTACSPLWSMRNAFLISQLDIFKVQFTEVN